MSNLASFCLFSFFSHDKCYKWKSIDGVLGTRTRGDRMVGADESIELYVNESLKRSKMLIKPRSRVVKAYETFHLFFVISKFEHTQSPQKTTSGRRTKVKKCWCQAGLDDLTDLKPLLLCPAHSSRGKLRLAHDDCCGWLLQKNWKVINHEKGLN